ncbi:MAG: cobalamin-dependent protein [Cohaesibacter sp.]|nr:cobalamin-dependent protein [Cohaesibacter sp.]
MKDLLVTRTALLPEEELPKGAELLLEGRALSSIWSVGQGAFQRISGYTNEISYKKSQMSKARIMQHAHLGYRNLSRTTEAIHEIYNRCQERNVTIDRFGMCLDWSMGFPRDMRDKGMRGTGILLKGPEDFQALTNAAPSAMHFGDFMLGFPAALDNSCAALAAGATVIGNLGQYFTFRLPDYDDDVETTASTVKALGLIAAQPAPVLVHSNLDDGFAAMYNDLTTAIGQAMVEKYIVTELIGAPYAVCYGHHFTQPLTRIAFQRALAKISDGVPGSQVYGATVLYKGNDAENFASLSSYLLADICAQYLLPTGHAVNPVPVTENERIPDIEEVIDAQCHLARLAQLAPDYLPILNLSPIDETRDQLLSAGHRFKTRLLHGFEQAGINIEDPFEMLLAMRRLGGRRLEAMFGEGQMQDGAAGKRVPVVPATTYLHIKEEAEEFLRSADGQALTRLGRKEATILTVTTDVHEHGKTLLDEIFNQCGFDVVDGGISADPDQIVAKLAEKPISAIALSTYNGVALTFSQKLQVAMREAGYNVPVLIGGRLNQIPQTSNSSLPVDVMDQLSALGYYPCKGLGDILPVLNQLLAPDLKVSE